MSIIRPTLTDVRHFGGGFGAFASRGIVESGSVVPFTAASQPNCILALRADLGVSVTGTNVTQWSDQSGSGNHATASANWPQYTASNNYIGFTAASTQSFVCNGIANPLNNTDQACSIFTLAYRTDSLAQRAILGVGQDGQHGIQLYGSGTQSLWIDRRDSSAVQVTVSQNNVWSNATWEIVGATISGTTANLYSDTTGSPSLSGAAFDVGTITPAGATANGRIGATSHVGSAFFQWDGRIAALCVYNTNHAGATASAIVANLYAWARSVGLMP